MQPRPLEELQDYTAGPLRVQVSHIVGTFVLHIQEQTNLLCRHLQVSDIEEVCLSSCSHKSGWVTAAEAMQDLPVTSAGFI